MDPNLPSVSFNFLVLRPLRFVGTNAYWLPTLNTDDDIDYTLGNISSAGIKVVRVWAFNGASSSPRSTIPLIYSTPDVKTIPDQGTWFQLIAADGTTQLNTGANGLQKLDTIFSLAKKHNLYILLTLTNNWNPVSDTSTPRNYLSNDYGQCLFFLFETAVVDN